jgi:hypothetical protein
LSFGFWVLLFEFCVVSFAFLVFEFCIGFSRELDLRIEFVSPFALALPDRLEWLDDYRTPNFTKWTSGPDSSLKRRDPFL